MRRIWVAGVLLAAFAAWAAGPAWAGHKEAVTFGGALSETGRYAEPAGRFKNSYVLFADQQNAAGGVLGHKMELVLMDDKSDKQTSIKLYEKLITQDKVDFVLGPYSSDITDAVANIIERYKYPMMAPGASSRVIWEKGRKYIFNQSAVAQDYQRGSLHLAKEIGVKRVAIIGEDSLFSRQSRDGAIAWAKRLGIQVVLVEDYPTKQTDFTALLQKIKARGADMIVSNSYFADAVAQVRQLKELDINLKVFSGTVGPGLPKFATQLGPIAEYVLGFSQWEPKPEVIKTPGTKEFTDAYEKRFGVKPNYHAGIAYAAMQILTDGIKKAGTFDRQKVWQTLRGMETSSILGRWKVDDAGMNDYEGLTFQILNGKRVIVWPPKFAEAKPTLPMPTWKARPTN